MRKMSLVVASTVLLLGCSGEGFENFMQDWHSQKVESDRLEEPVPYDTENPDDVEINSTPAVEGNM
ncbi:MAG: hypothetical protein H6851_14550 [Geminicoccaceae bacterium]|nr:hypothetical protein [Geminicoccaceae bacterium]MCB9944825.1 hypothetical protein [Geminicoccaceae bacterium]